MKSRSLVVSTLLSAALLSANSGLAASAESWTAPNPATAPSDGSWVVVNENGGFDLWSNRMSFKNTSGSQDSFICADGLGDKECNFSDVTWRFEANQILPWCRDDVQENCIEGLAATRADGTVVTGSYLHTIAGERWRSIPETNLYEATMPSLFQLPGVVNAGGTDTYVVALKAQVEFDRVSNKFETRSLSANLFAYSTKLGGFTTTRTESRLDADGVNRVYVTHDPNCLFTEVGVCGLEEDFPEGVAFKLDARVSSDIAGWFHGRMTEQDVQIERFSSSNNRISITAKPVDVARMAVIATKKNSSSEAQKLLLSRGGHGGYTAFAGNSIKDFWATEGESAFFALNEWRDEMQDTAAGISTIWNFATVGRQPGNECMIDKSKVLGMVTTNATLYSGIAPEFVNGQLKYTVGGLHYQPDGKTLNAGTYDLVIRSEVARCLYGFSKAPIYATISVSGEGGENRVATTVVKETPDGWLKLAAYGFNFSSPTISVQLSQAKATVKKITVVCVSSKNKKVIKKITAVSPKCPSGYKKR